MRIFSKSYIVTFTVLIVGVGGGTQTGVAQVFKHDGYLQTTPTVIATNIPLSSVNTLIFCRMGGASIGDPDKGGSIYYYTNNGSIPSVYMIGNIGVSDRRTCYEET
jgi:hypothetical protein